MMIPGGGENNLVPESHHRITVINTGTDDSHLLCLSPMTAHGAGDKLKKEML